MAANLLINLPHSTCPGGGKDHPASFPPRRLSPRSSPNIIGVAPSKKQGSLIRRETEDINVSSRRNIKHGKETKKKSKSDAMESLMQDIGPSSFQNSIFHIICTEMLEEGSHQSFTELYHLVERQRSDHKKAGPASILLEPLIEHNRVKLEYLRVQILISFLMQLTVTEDAYRSNDLDTVYMAQRNLAQYFEHTDDAKKTKDKWLSDYFYKKCLETGSMVQLTILQYWESHFQVQGDNRHKEGEAHCHVGLAFENRGNLTKASFHMETFHQLAHEYQWHTESGDSLHDISCEHLRRIYTSIAQEVQLDNPDLSITYLKKAYDIAKEGGDGYQEGKASYRLGNAFEAIGDSDSAIVCHKQYLERCRYHDDEDGVGRAYEALAKSFESKGDINTAITFLAMFVNVTERVGLQDSLADACSAIGTMYNTMGDYNKAMEYFRRCYQICSKLNNTSSLYAARVQYGIAKGHQFMGSFSSSLTDSSLEGLHQLVMWKGARVTPEYSVQEEEEEDKVEDKVEEEGDKVEDKVEEEVDKDKVEEDEKEDNGEADDSITAQESTGDEQSVALL